MIKKIILLIVFQICLIPSILLAENFVIKGVTASKCDKIIELYNIDSKRAEQVLKSVFQSFLTGYNFRYYQDTRKFKDLNVTAEYVFETVMRDCRKNKKESVHWILTDFWKTLDWGK
tara:strand:+ start:194 stop:544 length:351 start_codon:yes stop_codon:yes gene_type:complete